MARVSVTVDGVRYVDDVEPRTLLVHYLRDQLGKVGTVVGCDTSNCGACTVLMSGPDDVAREREELLGAGRAGRRLRRHHRGGAGRRRRHAAPGTARLPRAARAAVRLLHARHDHGGGRPAEGESTPDRGGDPRGHVGQPVPLHRLPEHRPRRPGRRRTAACRRQIGELQHAGRRPAAGAGDRARRRRRWRHDRHHRRTGPEVGRAAAAQGGRAPGHRPHQLDREHHAARHAAPGHPAQPVRPRPHHQRRTPRRRRTARTCWPRSAGPTWPTPRACWPAPGRSPRTWSRRRTCRWPSTRCATWASRSPSWWPATGPARWTRSTRSRSSTSRCRWCWTSRRRWPRARRWCTPTRAPTSATPGSSTRPRPAPAATWPQAEAEAEVVIKRRYVQQRLIPAFMEPRSVIVDPRGGEWTVYSATQIPHIVRFLLAATTGTPEHKIRVIAPDVGGGFGGKLAVTPEEWIAFAVATKTGRPVKYTESRAESHGLGPPRARRDPGHHADRQPRRHGHRAVDVEPDRQHGRVPGHRHAGRADARRVHVQRHLQVPGLPVRVHRGLHQHHQDRRVPGRRPARGHLRHRAHHGRARGRARAGPDRGAAAQLDQARGVPVHHRGRAGLRLGQLRGGHRQGVGAAGLRRPAGRAGGPPGGRRPGAAGHRHLHLHRDVRAGAVAGARRAALRRGRLGVGRRSGSCRPARSR